MQWWGLLLKCLRNSYKCWVFWEGFQSSECRILLDLLTSLINSWLGYRRFVLWFQPFSFRNLKIWNTKCWPLITIPPPSFLCRPNPSTLTWQQMAPARVQFHFCVDSWTLHLQKMIKHSHQNHQIMKVLQARDPLDFVLHCSNRSLNTLKLWHAYVQITANICCCVPSYND